MNTPPKTYDSPLRRRQQAATRDAILEAAGLLVEERGLDALSFAAVAERAGVQERTVYRHFPTRGELLAAFWTWVNDQAGIAGFPDSEAALRRLPPAVFARFDERAGMMRALVFSEAGRQFRLAVNGERQAAYRTILAERLKDLDPAAATRICAVVQLLYSATAWATLRDCWPLDGKAAGETVAWAIDRLLAAVEAGDCPPIPETSESE
ncbi:TetR/AcrR family transcriptional regulator [Zavarzinia compransoris]|uniref:TetR/AcrR family transcriptional regulator n=1 Tax=Zavarzinia compransoris TaxID=1264899 RepID=A0A317E0A9_9PROT|nr:TetR/AcrR family transcriptional regulator [Zavarzinia compransoris]PWR20071.1 TetR/AcrR family transcriptional regulator [Zavarzinia compransoris]TDP44807.1 TetR family transcriptional regulator [Zavarzinia compransoris]